MLRRVSNSKRRATCHRPRHTLSDRLLRLEPLEDRALLASLVAAYGFDEGAGSNVADVSGNSNDGTIGNATWTAAGRYGNALSFNGSDALVTVQDSDSLDLTTGMTLEAWVQPSIVSSGWRDVIFKGLNDIYYLEATSSGGGAPGVGGTFASSPLKGPTLLPSNTWSHLAGTYDGTTLRLYVDGAEVASKPQSGLIETSSSALTIGGDFLYGQYFSGLIDEVRIYDGALSAAEIQADMNTPVSSLGAPSVTAVTPLMGAKDVSTSVALTAQFSEPMDAATITSSTFELRDPLGVLVPATVSYDGVNDIATLTPTSSLPVSADYYTATVVGGSSGVKSVSSVPLPNDFRWSFSTGDPVFQDLVVFDGLVNPTVIRFSPDGRVFVAEKSGLIKAFDDVDDTTPTVFADLRTEVHNYWDRGLLGMTLHSDFPNTPYMYVVYTHDAPIGGTAPNWGTVDGTFDSGPGTSGNGPSVSGRVSRLTVGTDNSWDGNELVLVEDWGNQYPSHSIGTITFGGDGALYVSGGDGASFSFADYGQTDSLLGATALNDPPNEGGALRSLDLRTPSDPTTLDGTIIRIDPDTGAALSDNPLFNTGNDENARRIIAQGLRNPFRFTFRPGTNELWVGDVGWGVWEEINQIDNPIDTRVENFGWPAYEGPNPQGSYQNVNPPLALLEDFYAEGPAAHDQPYFAYRHDEQVDPGSGEPTGSSAIAGLVFSQGGGMPAGFDDALFFTDYNRDTIWVMYRGVDGLPDGNNREVFFRDTGNRTDAVNLEIAPDGSLFWPDFDSGQIRSLRYVGANQPPTAVIAASTTSGTPPLTVDFDGLGSSDPDPGDTLTYAWDLDGDNLFDDSTSPTPSFTYTDVGVHQVQLRVTDSLGLSATASVEISVGNAPAPVIDTPLSSFLFQANQTIAFSGHADDLEDGALPDSALTWTFSFYQADELDPTNINLRNQQVFAGVSSGNYTLPDWPYPVYLEIALAAVDSDGISGSTMIRVDPETVVLTFATDPAGLTVNLNERAKVTPFDQTVVVGSVNSVSVDSPVTLGGTIYQFESWSDGGSQTHLITAPATATTYTATYSELASAPGLVAAYSFDEGTGNTAADSSLHANDGVVGNAVWTTAGRFGNGLSFNGSDALVTVPDSDSLDLTTGMTLEAWVQPSIVSSGWRDVIFKGLNDIYYLEATSSGGGAPGVGGTFASGPLKGPTPLPTNAWSHLAGTYDGTTLRLYVDGVEVANQSQSGLIETSSAALTIGGDFLYGQYFTGLIDEVRIYDRALSAAEIQADMNTPITPPIVDTEPPVVALTSPPDGATVSGTVTLSADATDNVAVAGVQFMLDGFDLGAEDTTAPYSLAWDTTTASRGIHTLTAEARDAAGNVTTSVSRSVTVVPQLLINSPVDNSTIAATTVDVTYAIQGDATGLDQAYFVLDGGPEIIDDTLDGSFQLTNVALGPHTLSGYLIDTASQESGSTVNFTTVAPESVPPNVAITNPADGATVNGVIQVTADATDNVAVAGVQFFLDGAPLGVEDTVAPYEVSWDTTTVTNGQYVLTSQATDVSGNSATSAGVTVTVDNASGLVLALAFDEGSGGTTVDNSGNGNDGSIGNAVWTTAGRFGNALSFNGSNALVTVPDADSLDLTTGMTLQAWVHPSVVSGRWRDVIFKGLNDIYYLEATSSGGGAPGVGGTFANSPLKGPTTLPTNAWSHLAGTYDGITLRLYVDGVEVANQAQTGLIETSADALTIGGDILYGQYFAGLIDEVRIYNRALSAAEIQADMNTPIGGASATSLTQAAVARQPALLLQDVRNAWRRGSERLTHESRPSPRTSDGNTLSNDMRLLRQQRIVQARRARIDSSDDDGERRTSWNQQVGEAKLFFAQHVDSVWAAFDDDHLLFKGPIR